jgi:hypothetical protein
MTRQLGDGGLLGLGNTFRAMSPFQQAADLTHRVARQRLEAGGATAPAAKSAKPVMNGNFRGFDVCLQFRTQSMSRNTTFCRRIPRMRKPAPA